MKMKLPLLLFFIMCTYLINGQDKVGIGITAPKRLLHLDGMEPTLRLSGIGSNPVNSGTIEFSESDGQAHGNFIITYDGSDAASNKFLIKSWNGSDFFNRLSIDRNSGRVGIGNGNPKHALHIGNGTYSAINLSGLRLALTDSASTSRSAFIAIAGNPGGGGVEAQFEAAGSAGKVILGSSTAHPLHIRTSNSDRIYIASSGNVGVGTTQPEHLFDVQKIIGADTLTTGMTGNRLSFERTNGPSYIDKEDDSDLRFRFGSPVADKVIMKNDGRVGIGLVNPLNRLDISSDGVADTTEIVLGLMSNISNRPVLQFSEGTAATPTTGMSIEYDGTGATTSNRLHIRGVDAKRKFTVESGGDVGVGVANPNEKLEIGGDGRMFIGDGAGSDRKGLLIDAIESGGYVRINPFDYGPDTSMNLYIKARKTGIGTSAPVKLLHVNSSSDPTIRLGGTAGNPTNAGTIEFCEDGSQPSPNFLLTYDGVTNRLMFKSGTQLTPRLVINRDNGTIGMGGAVGAPTGYMLAVDGKIISEEIRVENSDVWPDFVFERSYPLMSLVELKKSIEENRHLPNVPSASEIEENGQHLGEIQRLLLEKIEELTLYVIQLNGQNSQMQLRLEQLEGEITDLKSQKK